MNEKETVYLVRSNGLYKIGRTNDFPKRLKQMQTGNPYVIEPIRIYKTEHSAELESFLHNRLQQYHFRGEWFQSIIIDDVTRLVEEFEKTKEVYERHKLSVIDPYESNLIKGGQQREQRAKDYDLRLEEILSKNYSIPYKKYIIFKAGLWNWAMTTDIIERYGIDKDKFKRVREREYN